MAAKSVALFLAQGRASYSTGSEIRVSSCGWVPSSPSNRGPRGAKTVRVLGGAPARTRHSHSRHVLSIGLLTPVLVLGLVSCGKKKPLVTDVQISETVVFRGVFVGPPGLPTPGPRTGTLSLSVTEVWAARSSIPDPLSPEAIATIDSVAVQVVAGDARSTFSGRLDRSTGALTVSGASWLNSTMTNGRFAGVSGDRAFLVIPPATQTIRAYCGNWSGTRPSGDDRGVLSFLVDGTVVTGVVRNDDGTIEQVEGSYDALGEIVMTFPGYTLTGSRSGDTLYGHYISTLDTGRSGTWVTGANAF